MRIASKVILISLILIIVSVSGIVSLSILGFARVAPFHYYKQLEFIDANENAYLRSNGSIFQEHDFKDGISVSVWAMMYPQTVQGQNPLICKSGYQFYLDGETDRSKFTWILWDNNNTAYTTSSPDKFEFTRWYNVIGSWNSTSNETSLFVNGQMVDREFGPTSFGPTSLRSDPGDWLVGFNDNNYNFTGRMTNLQIYGLPMQNVTAQQIFSEGIRGAPPASNTLLGWWKLTQDYSTADGKSAFQQVGELQWAESEILAPPFDVLSLVFVYLLIASGLSLLPFIPVKSSFIECLKRKSGFYIAGIFFITAVALLTPLSGDFLNILHTSSFSQVPIGLSPQEGGFWFIIVHFFSSIWRVLPVSHPNIQMAFTPPFDMYFTTVPPPPGGYLINFFYGEGASGLFAWVLVARLPYILLSLGSAFLIYKILVELKISREKAMFGSLFWLLNPVSILLIDMFTSNDSIMVLFLLASVYFSLRGKNLYSAVFFGLAIAVRIVPIIFLPIMLLVWSKTQENTARKGFKFEKVLNWLTLASYVFIPLAVFAIANSPVFFVKNLPLISNPSQGPSSLLLASSYQFFFGTTFGGVSLNLYGFRYGLGVIIFVLALFFVAYMYGKKKIDVVDSFLLLLLSLFVSIQWNPQYWLWILPFISIKIVTSPENRKVFALLLGWFLLINVTLFGYYFSTNGKSFFLFPNYNSSLQNLSLPMSTLFNDPAFIGLRIDEFLISVFAGIILWIIVRKVYTTIKAPPFDRLTS